MEVRRPRSDPRHVASRHRFETSLVRLPPRFFLATLPSNRILVKTQVSTIFLLYCFKALYFNLAQLASIFSAIGIGYSVCQESIVV